MGKKQTSVPQMGQAAGSPQGAPPRSTPGMTPFASAGPNSQASSAYGKWTPQAPGGGGFNPNVGGGGGPANLAQAAMGAGAQGLNGGKSGPAAPNYSGLSAPSMGGGAGRPLQQGFQGLQEGFGGGGTNYGDLTGRFGGKSPVKVPNMPGTQVNPQQLASQMRTPTAGQPMTAPLKR